MIYKFNRGDSESANRRVFQNPLNIVERIETISGKKILLIPEEELPKLLRSKPVTLAEYELDTPEKRSALERLFAMLERRKRPGK